MARQSSLSRVALPSGAIHLCYQCYNGVAMPDLLRQAILSQVNSWLGDCGGNFLSAVAEVKQGEVFSLLGMIQVCTAHSTAQLGSLSVLTCCYIYISGP